VEVHPTAIISKKAKVAEDVDIGPFTVIEEGVNIDSGVKIGPYCHILGNTSLGENCRVFTGAVIGSPPQDLKYKGDKSYVMIGKDNIIREYVTINPGTKSGGKTIIGDGNLLMAYVHIAHDCHIGNNIIIANLGTLAGHVIIEDGAIIGGLVAIHQFVRIGTLAIIGGCSKVVQDVPPYSTCDGHPVKIYGVNNVGLKRAGIDEKKRFEIKKALRIMFHSKLSLSHAIEKVKKELPPSKELTHLIEFVIHSKRGISG
jgi:UDP-N-acetylglucosamine acyltransferase